MKRIISLMLVIFLLAACTGSATPGYTPPPPQQVPGQESLRVVTTIFPQFDFVRQIAGDRVELTMLISPGAESHSFEPTPRDMLTINNADLLIYVGGHSEAWVHPILNSLGRGDLRTVALLEMVELLWMDHHHDHSHDHSHSHAHHDHDHNDAHDHNDDHHHHEHVQKDEEHDLSGHQNHVHNDDDHHHDHNDDHHHSHDHHHGHHHHHGELEADEHIWTSPANAALIVLALANVLGEMDPDNAYYFRANAAAYVQELEYLDQAFRQMVSEAARCTIVFGDRFPFRYLTEAYGLCHYAAFPGCASETQASPAVIAHLIDTVNEQNIPVVFYIEFSERLIANVIAEATGARLLELHSIHNVSQSDFDAGVTYLELMNRNLERLREALN